MIIRNATSYLRFFANLVGKPMTEDSRSGGTG
ncbi:hypothetical protein SAMN04489724_4317 [Algoriphagus locisalis]|uniref:Uncharacterized protein n=1 Tax=Algoriphagus locisalis TaxID=305507 RepID=A0A1I7DQX6_9BACT|nr:hypothetical protein SAMN04489724_4317 [Algoriphagus locisalis]